MKHFNLSEWALQHRALVLYLMLALAVMGTVSYGKLGQSEDPPFTFKVMVVRTNWPGATAREVAEQVTDRIEKKLQEAPYVDVLKSYSKPGESLVLFLVKDSAPAAAIPEVWYQVRKKVGDIRQTLPAGIQGPFFNDEFGDTFGNIYALTGDGFDYAELKQYADRIRLELLRLPGVAKVEFFGEQEEKIFIEISNAKLANLGINPQAIFTTLQQENALAPSGVFDTASDRIFLRVSGNFSSPEAIREISLRANGRLIRLGDIARVYRGYVDPPVSKMRFRGKEAFGIGVSMNKSGDIIGLGELLAGATARIQAALPVGVDLHVVSNQPDSVKRSVSEFARSLAEAVIIVLAVSLLSLGLRTGIVVALSIPLVLAITLLCMNIFDIGLHKISLGALILSLGLLVDDAIIAVEMMARKMEEGWDRVSAASFAYTSTAMPMLTGTLVTAAGFLPIATAASSTGEYTRAIFQVVVIALLVSWVAAVVFIPYIGFKLLPDFSKKNAAAKKGQVHPDEAQKAVYDTPFFRRFRVVVDWCVAQRKTVIAVTVGLFALSVFGFGYVQQQFFPDSTRLELLVDMRLPEGASYAATEAAVKKLEAILDKEQAKGSIDNYVSYVGIGSPRFYLPLDQQLANTNFAQFVILARGQAEREALRSRMIHLFEEDFPGLRASINRLENGPPVGFPVQFRVSGEDIPTVRSLAAQVAEVMRANRNLQNVQYDWDAPAKVVKLNIDQNKARVLGISAQELASFLSTSLNGYSVTFFRERDKLVEVLLRGADEERVRLSLLANLSVPTPSGKPVALSQIAAISYGFEEGIIWRRNRLPTVTVRANVYGRIQAPAVTAQIEPRLEAIRAALPPGYLLETGGAVEGSAKGGKSVAAGVPLFLVVVFTVLMVQLQSFQRVLLVVLTAPLGLIGVTIALLLFNVPFGFVAMLGTIALSGMIMRNSVILVDQIEQDIAAGHPPWIAIVDSTVRRFRPIVLTAAAAVLAMIPLTRSAFFGPMAVAIMGGLVVATVLTLLFLPALYAAWFRVTRPQAA